MTWCGAGKTQEVSTVEVLRNERDVARVVDPSERAQNCRVWKPREPRMLGTETGS
jgi:hypothetical protein